VSSVEPPPALTSAQKIEAGVVPTGGFGAAYDEPSWQFTVRGDLACYVQ